MDKQFEKYLRREKERFIRHIRQNKIQWRLADNDVVVIEDFVLAYEAMYNELLTVKALQLNQQDKIS